MSLGRAKQSNSAELGDISHYFLQKQAAKAMVRLSIFDAKLASIVVSKTSLKCSSHR